MKQLTVVTTRTGAGKQSIMSSSTVNAMHVYFQSDKRKMGKLEQSIMNSVNRLFDKQPPKDAA